MKRLIIAVVALGAALLAQLTIVNGLPLPGGGEPDLVLLCVIAIGLVNGQEPGLIAGFCAGLALDLAPPATELVGQYALAFCLVGYVSGRLSFALRRSAMLVLTAAAVMAVAGEVLVGIGVVALDTPRVTLAAVGSLLPSSALYDVVLSPVVMFAAVRIAVALGISLSPVDDSPALEPGGSAQPMGLARLARLRHATHPTASDGTGAGPSWLTGDSVATLPAVGTVGWLSGPPATRKARRQQARLIAALTGAEPRRGAVWVGTRPPGLRPTSGVPSAPASSGLAKLKPGSGIAGSATRDGLAGPAGPAGLAPSARSGKRGADGLPKIAFGSQGSGVQAAPGRAGGERSVPKIAFGSQGSGVQAAPGRAGGDRGVPKIAFGTGGGATARPAGKPAGASVPKIAFGTGGLPGAGRAGGRGVPRIRFGGERPAGGNRPQARRTPRIAFRAGLPKAPRTSPGRPALPRFAGGSGRSAAGSWLAGSRLRSAQFGGGAPRGAGRGRRLKAARWGRKRGRLPWLPFVRRAGGRSSDWRIGRQMGGDR